MNLTRLACSAILLAGLTAPLHALTPAPNPLAPIGRVSTGARPEFRWTDTGAAKYSFRWMADVGGVLSDEVKENRYVPSTNLKPGAYTWQVRHGPLADANANPWSAPTAFVIAPERPLPSEPTGWINRAAWTNPVFHFTCPYNINIHRFTMELFRDSELLETVHATNLPRQEVFTSLKWKGVLQAGAYQWRIRSSRLGSGNLVTIHSDWSPTLNFSVAVPGQPVVTNPPAGLVLIPGPQHNRFTWTAPQGSSGYRMKVLQNDSRLTNVTDIAQPSYNLLRNYFPGYYTVFVAGTNHYGSGPWSKGTSFLVRRLMNPGEDTLLNTPPTFLSFYRSEPATHYKVTLSRYAPSTGRYETTQTTNLPQSVGGGLSWTTPSGWYPDGAYKWTVTDYNGDKKLYTSSDYFSVRVPPRPTPLGPNGFVYGHKDVTFTWLPAASADAHQLQVWKDGAKIADTGWMVKNAHEKAGGMFRTLDLPGPETAAFTWRARAKNVYGVGAWRGMKTTVKPLTAPVITIPSNGTVYASGAWIETRWKSVKTAKRYQVQIWKNGVFDDDAEFEAFEGTFYHFLSTPGTFTIKVRAGDAGFGPWAKRTVTVY
jgi:hypothetical protein